jgi:membrane protease YdiL (CAAX protease family)
MTDPGAGHRADDDAYTGPPPMVRPGSLPWQQAVPPWQQAVPPWQQAGPPWTPPPPVTAVRWAPPPGTLPHDVPRPFLLAMRTRDWAWWRPLLGLLLISVVWFVAATLVVGVTLLTGVAPDLAFLDLADPAVLLVTNLTLIVGIPAVWLAWAVAHGLRTGWSSSVLARLRWRLMPPLTLLAAGTLGVGIVLSVFAGLALGDQKITGPVPSFGWLLLVVLLTTPLQSAAEEYLFRGYLSQTIAGWIRHPRAGPVVAAVLTAALFSALHAPGDVPTFLDRFAFGLAASAVVWLTGGLEAAIVHHAINNVLVFVLAGALGEGVATEEVPQGTGALYLLVSVLSLGAYVAIVARHRHRLHPETHTAAQDLRTPGASVPTPAG